MKVTAGYYLMKTVVKHVLIPSKITVKVLVATRENLLLVVVCAGSIGYGKLMVKQNLLNQVCLIWSKSWYNQYLTSGEYNESLF
jgi:hypothetical protein